MNGEQGTIYSDKDSVLRRILEESPLSNGAFSTDIADDDSHKYNRVRSTKTPHKRRSRKDKDKDVTSYPVGARDVARLLLNDEREALRMRKLLEQTAERLQIESKRAMDAEKRAAEAETRMIEVLHATRDTQRELLRDREVLRAYQTQVETAKGEILKAQKELDSLAEEKYKVEQEAARERSRYRQLEKEVEVKQALERGRLEGFVDGRKEGWYMGKEYARGNGQTWRDAEYYSEGEDSASIITSDSTTTGLPPLTGPPFEPLRPPAAQSGAGQAPPVTMPVPEVRLDLPGKTVQARSMTPHSYRRVASAMQSPKSRASAKSHRRSSHNISMPVPHPAPAPGPGPSGLRQNTLSTEDDGSIKSPSRVFSTKTPLRPSSRHSSVRAPSTRPDVPPIARTPLNAAPPAAPPSPRAPQASQPFQPMQPSQSPQPMQPPVQQHTTSLFEAPQSQELPPIRPIPSPRPRPPSHSPISPLPEGFIPVLDENGQISLPPPHEVDPYPLSPLMQPQSGLSENNNLSRSEIQRQSQPPFNINVNFNSGPPQAVNIEPVVQTQPPIQTTNFPTASPAHPPAQDFTIPVPEISPWRQQPSATSDIPGFIPQNSPRARSPSVRSERRSPRTPVMNIQTRSSPIQAVNDQFNDMNIAAELFEPDENGFIPGTEGYVPPRGNAFRPLSAIPEGGSTTAESPKFASRNPSAASFRQGPRYQQYQAGSSFLNKPQPPIPPRSPSMMGRSPVSPRSGLPNVDILGNHGIYNDPREYEDVMDLRTSVSPSRQQLAEHLRPAPLDGELRDDVSIRTSTSKASGRDRIGGRRYQSRDVERLEKHAEVYANFGSGQPFPFNSSDSSRDSPETPRASYTPAPRRSPSITAVPRVTLMEPSPPNQTAQQPHGNNNRSASRASSRRHSIVSIRSVDDVAPFIPPSPSQFQPANPVAQDFRIVKNSPAPPGFVPMHHTPSVATQSRMPTVGRLPTALPDRTPAMGFGSSGSAFPPTNVGLGFGATPLRTALPFSVSSTVRNLPGGTQGAPSVRATPARMPVNMNANINSTTTTVRKLPAALPSRGTGRTIPSELPPMGGMTNFGTSGNPPAGFVPQPPAAMSAASYNMPMPTGATPHIGQGMFIGRTPGNPTGNLLGAASSANVPSSSNAAHFNTGSTKEQVPLTTSKEPARLPGLSRASVSMAGKTPGRLPAFMPATGGEGGESSQQWQTLPQATPAQAFPGFLPYDFGVPAGFRSQAAPGPGPADPSTFKPTPASGFKTMSNARLPARLPDRNSSVNTPARLPLPPSNANTPWMTGAPLTNSRPPGTLPTPISDRQQPFIPPSPHVSAQTAVHTPGRMGFGLPTGGGSRAASHTGSPMRSSSPYQRFDNPVHFTPSRPTSRAESRKSAHGTVRHVSSYLVPPGEQVTQYGAPVIESASDEDDENVY